MTKAELVSAIAKTGKIRKKDAEAFLNAFVEVVKETLAKGEKIEIRNFGTFYMKEKARRVARNPRTGKKVRVPAKLSPSFRPGKILKEVEKTIG
ncbi:MAG: DNA-binding protein [Desulfurobacterium sp.]|nr:MAG: DNA-binding protein [Desulfurobacterium sp.]